MAQTDNFAFAKSEEVQGVSRYTPYQKKVFNNLNDINGGVYTNTTQSLVQFDLSSIYNSGAFTDSADLFITLPIIMVAEGYTDLAAAVAPTTGANTLLALKSGYHQLCHQLEVQAGGKIVADSQPFVNVARNFKILSQMTANELRNLAPSLGMADVIDSSDSPAFFTTAAGSQQGVGFCNNIPYNATGVSVGSQSLPVARQNDGVANAALAKRIARITSASQTAAAATSKNIYGAAQTTGANQPFIATAATLVNEFRPYYTVSGTKMVWYDVAILPLRYLTDVMDKLGLVRKLDLQVRMYINTGSLVVPLTNSGATLGLGYPTTNTFTNTCPMMINYVPSATAAACNVAATMTQVACGLYLARVPTTSLAITGGTANLAGPASHPMPSCRAYYSQIKLDPSVAQKYITENSAKEIVFENFIFNQYNGIGAGTSFSQLVQSGIKNPLGILIVPFISSGQARLSDNSTGSIGFSQYQSPYDSAPASGGGPLSLTNLQINLGGTSVLDSSSLYYTFENWLEQVSIAETVVPEMGLAQGILSQKDWESLYRLYYVSLARGTEADKATMRNLSISFTNNSAVAIDILVFTFYLNRGVVNVETGLISM
jgi:hypothetical protein